jgi:hypothetical protein
LDFAPAVFLFQLFSTGPSGDFFMIELSGIGVRVAPRRRQADEWALVLEAEGLSPSVWHAPEGFVVGVPADEVERASATLSCYESENAPRADEGRDEPAGSVHLYVALAVWVVLLDLFFITDAWEPAARWFEHGSADAERIVAGELWRTVTALTLHADLKHALANAVAGAIFLTAVCRRLGPGLGVALVLLTGVGGNLINAFAHDAFHVSVGASTAQWECWAVSASCAAVGSVPAGGTPGYRSPPGWHYWRCSAPPASASICGRTCSALPSAAYSVWRSL